MSSKTSKKSLFKRGSKKPSEKKKSELPKKGIKAEVFQEALGELMDMSDDDLMSSLSPESSESKESSANAAAHSTDKDSDTNAESTEKADAKESDSSGSDSKLIEDPITLQLIKSGVVNINQVSEALPNRSSDEELWRSVASVEGVDADAVYAAVAKASGVSAYLYLDAAPTRELVMELVEMMSPEKLALVLENGMLPVDLDPSSDDTAYKLMLVSHDPTNAANVELLQENEIAGSCLFAPRQAVVDRIATVKGWLTSTSPFGFESVLESDEEESQPEAGESEKAGESAETPNNGTVYDAGDVTNDANSNDATMDYQIEGDGMPTPEQMGSGDLGDEVIEIPSYDEELELPSRLAPASKDRVIRSILRSGAANENQVAKAIGDWQASGGREALWRILASQPDLNREAIYEEAARVYAFKQEEIGNGRPDYDFVVLTMDTVAEDQREELLDLLLLPFEHVVDYETGAGRMVFVTPDPTLPEVSRLLHDLDLGRFELRYAPESQISALLDELFPRKNEYLEKLATEDTAYDYGTNYEETVDIVDEEALEAEISSSKLINLFEATLIEATRMGASDIHIYPNPKRQVEIHFRLDGRLKHWHTEEGVAPEAFLSVVKDNSTNVDRFERDSAQDGFIQRRIDDALIRYRVSILPIATANQEIRAESIVIRILDDRKVITELTQLGMLDVALERFDRAIRQPHGMVILTGPTGSGKSTTLVAALHQVVTPEVNVLTVEDPVEYIINGVRQIKLSHKLSLEGALRSILRHDPDIVMVGEMRDQHTAELAIKLANTGHLTFSTLHTNDAPAAVSRLYKMGVEPFLIAYAINLVVAQRLIRSLCSSCKVEDDSPDTVLMKSLGWTDEEIGSTTVYKASHGTKCPNCSGIGYKGRRAICETLYFSDEIRHIIAESGTEIDEDAIRVAGIEEGMLTLMESAKRLVEMGETSLDEMLRTTGAE